MKISVQQYAESLSQALESVGPKGVDKVIENFLKILIQNGDQAIYKNIVEEYESISRKKRGISEAEITFAQEAKHNSKIVEELNAILGKKLEIKEKIDAEILGGVIIRADDDLIDASLKTQLKALNEQLKQ